eukprot:gene8314-10211_t
MRGIRGARISMVMQDPKFSLNPVMTVGEQISEALQTHHRLPRRETRQRVLTMLEAVRIDDPERVASGRIAQRRASLYARADCRHSAAR